MSGNSLLARPSRRFWTAIAASFFFLVLLYWSGPTQRLLSFHSDSNGRQVLEIEGLAIGQPFASTAADSKPADLLIASLKLRYNQDHYPNCSLNLARYESTVLRQGSRRNSVVGIVVNLHNSEQIIPAQSVAILHAVSELLKKNKVFLSIYENGSEDNSGALLADFIAAAQELGLDGIWATSSRLLTSSEEDRIVMLSEFRNNAMAPLLPHLSTSSSSTLIFVNDVVTCASDLLELVHQKRLQHADMVFGMDWGAIAGPEGSDHAVARLYDSWVARGLNGDLFYPFEGSHGYWPLSPSEDWVRDVLTTQSNDLHQLWLDGRPLPAYSGWGGMAAFDSSLFTGDHLRFRSSSKSGWMVGNSNPALGAWGKLVSDAGYLGSDCPGASECEYICRDIWNLRPGKARIVLAPQVRTTYSMEDWDLVHALVPAKRQTEKDDIGDLIKWTDVRAPSSVECIASRTSEGDHIDTWDESNERYRLDPIWHPIITTA